MQGSTLDVHLLPSLQDSPTTAAPQGRLKYVENGVCNKYDGNGPDEKLRIDKRNGFIQVAKAIRNVQTGTIQTPGFPATPTLFSSLGAAPVIVSAGQPYVFAQGAQSWGHHNYYAPPSRILLNSVFQSSGQSGMMDAATDGFSTICYVWRDLADATKPLRAYFVDANGSPLRLPFVVTTGGADCKVVYDSISGLFWVFWSDGGANLFCQAFLGTGFANTSSAVVINVNSAQNGHFDVSYQTGIGVMYAWYNNGSGVAFGSVTASGGGVVNVSYGSFGPLAGLGMAFLENYSGDGKIYIAGANWAGLPVTTVRVHKFHINAGSVVIDQTWSTQADSPSPIDSWGSVAQIAGYAATDGVRLLVGFWQNTSAGATDRRKAGSVKVFMASGGAISKPITLQGMVPVTRVYRTPSDSQPTVAMWYPSAPNLSVVQGVDANNLSGQPTYFTFNLAADTGANSPAASGQFTGRFCYGNAGAEWMIANGVPNIGFPYTADGFFHLPRPFNIGSDVHLPIGVAGAITNQQINNGDVNKPYVVQISSTGVSDLVYAGSVNGRAIEYANELLMPGAMASVFNGSLFSDDGMALAPEQPLSVVGSTAAGALRVLGRYDYILVWEATDAQGNRVRSRASLPYHRTLTGTQNTTTLTIFPLIATNRYIDPSSGQPLVSLAIYRSFYDGNGVLQTQHRKITSDLAPLNYAVNTNTANQTFTFVDTVSDAQCALGEILYAGAGGQGYLSRDPCPAFAVGCIYQDRVVVAGYDGRIWYSGARVAGDPLWFNGEVQTINMPTSDPVTAMAPLDGRILIFTASRIYELPATGFSDPTGASVSVESPRITPFTNGCPDGFTVATGDGLLYSCNAGGIYNASRGLDNQQFFVQVGDEFIDPVSQVNQVIHGADVDKNQKVFFITGSTKIMVWDQTSGVWTRFLLPQFGIGARLSHTVGGNYAFADDNSIWLLTDGLFYDLSAAGVSAPIITSIQTEMISFGGVKNFARVWDQILSGIWVGPHNLSVTTMQDTNGLLLPTNYFFTPIAGAPYQYSLPPTVEECSRVSFLIQDDFNGFTVASTGGNSATWELLSFFVGLEAGLTRLPSSTNRVRPFDYPVGGPIVGAAMSSTPPYLTIRLNGAQEQVTPFNATTFLFGQGLPAGVPWSIGVKQQPLGRTATFVPSSGIVGIGPVTSVCTIT